MLNYLIMSKLCKLGSIIISQMNQTPLKFIVYVGAAMSGGGMIITIWNLTTNREERINHEVARDEKTKSRSWCSCIGFH